MDEILFASALQRLRRNLLELKAELASVRVALAFRRAEREAKYNPNWSSQSRVPAGDRNGGQWTSGGGGGGAPHTPSPRSGSGAGRHAPPPPQLPLVSGPKPPPLPLPPRSFAEHVFIAAAQTPLVRMGAERLRDAQARIKDWTDKNIPCGVDVAMQVSHEAARTLANLAGPEALREYDDLADKFARGGAEIADAYHRRVEVAVAEGRITRRQADDANVIVSTTATLGMVLPVGKLGRPGKRVARVAPNIEPLHSLEEVAAGIRRYKVGDNQITLRRNPGGHFDSEFVVKRDYGDLSRSREVIAAQNEARRAGKPTDVGFHTLPHRLFPGLKEVITAGDKVLNASTWKSMENEIGRLARRGRTILGKVHVHPPEAKRASGFTMQYRAVDESGRVKRRFKERFPNRKPAKKAVRQ